MDSIVLAARLHSMGGAREDIRKAIESWNLEKKVVVDEQGRAVHDDTGAKEMFPRMTNWMQGEGFRRDATNPRPRNPNEIPDLRQEIEGDPNRKGADVEQSGAKGGRITDADRARVDQITGGNNAQSNVDASSKGRATGMDNRISNLENRFNRRQAGEPPSMGDRMKQGFGNVKEAVGNVGSRIGAAGSKALTSAGEAIGNAATAAKDKMGQAGEKMGQVRDKTLAATDDAMMGAARSLGRGVGTAQAKGSQMMGSAKEKAGQMGAKASELGGGMLDAAKRLGQGAYGKIQNAASKVPGMASAAKQKAGEIGAGVMGAAGQAGRGAMDMAGKAGRGAMDMAGKAGQAAMGAGRGVMNAASQLPGQAQAAYQGVKHGSQGGANRGGAYLPGIGGRVGNFAHGLKQGGLSGLMEQGVVGTTRAGQQDRYGIGRQESKDMRRLHDSNMRDASYAQARNDLTEGQQVAYGWDPESQPAPAPGTPAPGAAAPAAAGAAAPTPGDADGNGVPDVEETQTTSTDGATGEVTQTTERKVTPQPMDPAGGNTTGSLFDQAPAGYGGGGDMNQGQIQGGSLFDQAPAGYGNSSGNMGSGGGQQQQQQMRGGSQSVNVNVAGSPPGAGGEGAGNAGNPALDALTANAAERAGRTGGLARNIPLGIMTGGASIAAGGLANYLTRRGGKRDLQNLAPQYQKAVSIVEIRQDIEKGRFSDAFNALRGKNMSDEEMESNRARKRFEAIQQIERGKAFRAGHKPLTEHQYLAEADRMGAMHERGGNRIAPFYAPHPEAPPEEAPPEEAPPEPPQQLALPAPRQEAEEEDDQPIQRDDIVERSEPWTIVENPFDNPFYSTDAFKIRKEPAPATEVEHSIIEEFITEENHVEKVDLSGFETVEGDDLSLLPASVFAKSNPVGDDMSLLPSGWGKDVQ